MEPKNKEEHKDKCDGCTGEGCAGDGCDPPWTGDLGRVVEIPEVKGNPFGETLIGGGEYLPSHVERPAEEEEKGDDSDYPVPHVTEREYKKLKKEGKIVGATLHQVRGDHYKYYPIQPVVFITKNNLSFLEGCIIKRICRYMDKGDPLGDLQKIKHEVDLIIEMKGL